MADQALHGNGEPCPACELRREGLDTAPIERQTIDCNLCGGTGRIAVPPEEIIRRETDRARGHYWPAFDKRNGLSKES